MDADDAWSAEFRHLLASDPEPLALDTVAAERLLDGDLGPDQAPPGYAEVAALLAATVAAPSPAELVGQEAALAELQAVARAHRARTRGLASPVGVGGSGWWSRSLSVPSRPVASPRPPPGSFQARSVTPPGASSQPRVRRRRVH
jgi:hypothetical protein